jgi:hypothetical protein
MVRQAVLGRSAQGGRSLRRLLFVLMTALMLLGGSGWMVPSDATAGEVATVVTDGAPLFAEPDGQTVIEWMDAGTQVDFFYGPHNGMYEVRYHGTVGWTWVEDVARDGGSGGGDRGGEVSSGGERWIDIDRSNGTVTLYEGDTALATYYASLSRSQGEDYYSTASGTYYVFVKNRDLTYTEFARNYITHWVGFDPDRRNGFHSYLKYSDGSITPNGGGYTGGCVALAPGDIDAVYDFAEIGMRVEVHW